MAKTAKASRYTGSGIGRLRGVERSVWTSRHRGQRPRVARVLGGWRVTGSPCRVRFRIHHVRDPMRADGTDATHFARMSDVRSTVAG
ncbi:hypothetical protein GALLR39Z86_09670 [Glycomyces algeriensis]|uniref:Uncharacterized protein n=1 Tax=Glycomyces algeriensis TaxID=256037 RepID=A0A9W6G6A2_9ACTN|nr:hypothetical protein GALLR39Z86_09670 [Glycomyces algeriensis]